MLEALNPTKPHGQAKVDDKSVEVFSFNKNGLHRTTNLRDILAWNLEHGRDGLRVAREHVTDLAGNMLVDKDDRNVLSLAKLVERLLDRRNRCVYATHVRHRTRTRGGG